MKTQITLEGLDCEKCEENIITALNSENIKVDYDGMKVSFVVSKGREYKKIIKIIKKNIKYNQQIQFSEKELEKYSQKIIKKKLLTIGIASIPFFLGIILNIEDIYKIFLFLISYLIVGKSLISKFLKNIFHGNIFDENALMLIATIGAFIIGEYYEAVAVMAFYILGEMFQDLAVDNSRKSIAKLMDIKSDYANLQIENEIIKVNPNEVKIGSIIVVKPGEKVPIDGVVVSGEANMNTANITGESTPKFVSVGSEVYSGFVNLDQPLVIKTTKDYENSTVNKIIEMVEHASTRKAKTENFISKFAKVYTPTVVFIAIFLALIPPLVFNQQFNTWIYRALNFLVVSCPCALVISVPLSFYAGIGFASRNGILIKGGNFLEALKKSEEIIFDKTGTLTTGKFVISEINAYGMDKDKLLELAAICEFYSIHPIANTIKATYGKQIDQKQITHYEEYSGMGVVAIIDKQKVFVGNKKLLEKYNIEFEEVKTYGTVIYVALDGKYVGNLVIIDEIKKEAKEAISKLKAQGFKKVTMVTGDKKEVAKRVSENLGIDEIYSDCLPQDKVEILERKVKEEKRNVIFVGDGVNDAPVIAVANVGIAMGSMGSDAAIEASDIVIMNDDLRKIVKAKEIAKRTSKIVYENIVLALFIKILVLILAGIGIVNMWLAVFADVGVALLAILNAMRLLTERN